MYQPIYKGDQLLTGQGDVVVVTGWKPRDAVAKQLPPAFYTAIGQLYSPTRGISILVRNLLANPSINKLWILSLTREDRNSGASEALYDFFRFGFSAGVSEMGQPVWKIKSSVTAYVDKEIPDEALELLRASMSVIATDDQMQYSIILDSIRNNALVFDPVEKIRLTAMTYPQVDNSCAIIPGELYGSRISGKTITETWVKILHRIRTTGRVRPTGYGGSWQELIDVMAVVTDEPKDFHFPTPNFLPLDRDFLSSYIPQILEDAPYTEGVKYTYGQRLRSWFGRDQVRDVIQKLINEIDSASAVMSLWDTGLIIGHGSRRRVECDSDHDHGGSPCLNHIWLRVINNVLSMTATFRSNDMFNAWPANAMGLRALQRYIRDEIASQSQHDLVMGPLITISQSAHIYDDTWDNVDQLLKFQYQKICNSRDYYDPAGNFVVAFEGGQIIVQHITPGSGETVSVYRGKTAEDVYRQIATAIPHILTEHALYLGAELGKAEAHFHKGSANRSA